jgi:hypothetical protein
MGQYHMLVNLDKKEFVHPHQIGNGLKLHEQVGWDYATSTVLVMLLAASSGRGGGDFRDHELVGSWAGDRLAFIGDYAESKDVPGTNAVIISKQVLAAACPEEGKDKKPRGWKQWTNISGKVRDMMEKEFHITYSGDAWMQIKEGAPHA